MDPGSRIYEEEEVSSRDNEKVEGEYT